MYATNLVLVMKYLLTPFFCTIQGGKFVPCVGLILSDQIHVTLQIAVFRCRLQSESLVASVHRVIRVAPCSSSASSLHCSRLSLDPYSCNIAISLQCEALTSFLVFQIFKFSKPPTSRCIYLVLLSAICPTFNSITSLPDRSKLRQECIQTASLWLTLVYIHLI